MPADQVSGTQGYAEEADALFERYESISFARVHRKILYLLPTEPGRILDIGSATGRDAAALAALGHNVVAVEPTDALRRRAAVLHPSSQIEWLDDSLPDLVLLTGRGEDFDVVMLTAVWMHLDEAQRLRAMPILARLLRVGGVLTLTLRHGPVPPGRRMFDVSAEETIALAGSAGLSLELQFENQDSAFQRTDVSWTRLAFLNTGEAD